MRREETFGRGRRVVLAPPSPPPVAASVEEEKKRENNRRESGFGVDGKRFGTPYISATAGSVPFWPTGGAGGGGRGRHSGLIPSTSPTEGEGRQLGPSLFWEKEGGPTAETSLGFNGNK